jgi:hypothetical protein
MNEEVLFEHSHCDADLLTPRPFFVPRTNHYYPPQTQYDMCIAKVEAAKPKPFYRVQEEYRVSKLVVK